VAQAEMTLFDVMRLTALGAGLGASLGAASGVVSHGAQVAGAAVAGVFAIWVSEHARRRLQPWVVARESSPRLELGVAGFYAAVFVAVGVATYAGAEGGRILAAISGFR
jgi:hypothetical protein